jgi:hypothetical protein
VFGNQTDSLLNKAKSFEWLNTDAKRQTGASLPAKIVSLLRLTVCISHPHKRMWFNLAGKIKPRSYLSSVTNCCLQFFDKFLWSPSNLDATKSLHMTLSRQPFYCISKLFGRPYLKVRRSKNGVNGSRAPGRHCQNKRLFTYADLIGWIMKPKERDLLMLTQLPKMLLLVPMAGPNKMSLPRLV